MITVGIPCYNGADDLLPWCLQSIRDRTKETIDVVVVDDSGRGEHQKKTLAVAERFGVRWLAHDRNLGISASWNTLARASKSPFIALLNDDIVVAPRWLEAATYFLKENPHAGAAGLHFNFITRDDVPTLLHSPTATVPARDPITKAVKDRDDHTGEESPGRIMCPPGCCFAFTREKFDLVGGFDEGFKSFYEESHFGTALASRGFPTYALAWPTLFHIWSATFGRAPELSPGRRMADSKKRYIETWGGHFETVHPREMAKCAFRKVRWLAPSGPREEVIRGEHGFEVD